MSTIDKGFAVCGTSEGASTFNTESVELVLTFAPPIMCLLFYDDGP